MQTLFYVLNYTKKNSSIESYRILYIYFSNLNIFSLGFNFLDSIVLKFLLNKKKAQFQSK